MTLQAHDTTLYDNATCTGMHAVVIPEELGIEDKTRAMTENGHLKEGPMHTKRLVGGGSHKFALKSFNDVLESGNATCPGDRARVLTSLAE